MESNNLQLQKIQQNYRVKILYACVAGSRAWGLSSPYSDQDLAIVYHRPQEWYLSLFEKPDTIDLSKHTDSDGFGWDLRKVLKGLLQSNAVLYDWLFAPKFTLGCAQATKRMREIAMQSFDDRKVIFHYLGLGNHILHKYKKKEEIPIKSYMLLIRSTLAAMWVKEMKTPPPVLFSELLTIAESHPLALLPIHKVVMLKKQAKPDKEIAKIKELDKFISEQRRDCASYAEHLKIQKELPIAIAERLFQSVIFQEGNREKLFDEFITPMENEM